MKVDEWCPYCEYENSYDVDDDQMIVSCTTCGRPLLLCGKCGSECLKCPHEDMVRKLSEEWEKTRVGKMVWYDDPMGMDSGWMKVDSLSDGVYTLMGSRGQKITAYDSCIDHYRRHDEPNREKVVADKGMLSRFTVRLVQEDVVTVYAKDEQDAIRMARDLRSLRVRSPEKAYVEPEEEDMK